jgi:hypothetical protein
MKAYKRVNPMLVDSLLALYMQRCKFKHTIVFMQFRKLLPKAKLHCLIDIFKSRKEFFVKMVNKAIALTKGRV